MTKIIFMGLVLVGLKSFGAIVCEGNTSMGSVTVTYDKGRGTVIVSGGAMEQAVTYEKVAEVWDGHGTGLVTANGFAMKYNNFFGCIRNVEITTFLRTDAGIIDSFKVGVCWGGSTPDDLCFR